MPCTVSSDKKTIHPVLLLSTETINIPQSSIKETEEVVELETNPIEEKTETITAVTKRKASKAQNTKENKRLKFNILKEIRSDRKEYYKKRLEVEDKKLAEKIRKNNILEEHNVLLRKFLDKKPYSPLIDL